MASTYDMKQYPIVAIAGGTVQLVVGSTTQSLAELLPPLPATIPPITQEMVDSASLCQIRVATNSIKFMYDGGDPSSANGVPLAEGSIDTVQDNINVKNLKLTRNTGTDATIFVILEIMR